MDEGKTKEIKREISKLRKIFRELSEERKKLAENLIENAAFMAVTLRELQKEIDEKGAIIHGVNGNGFEVAMENPAQKSYNTMVNRYSAVIKQLTELLPDAKTEGAAKAGEALAAFVAKGKPKKRA